MECMGIKPWGTCPVREDFSTSTTEVISSCFSLEDHLILVLCVVFTGTGVPHSYSRAYISFWQPWKQVRSWVGRVHLLCSLLSLSAKNNNTSIRHSINIHWRKELMNLLACLNMCIYTEQEVLEKASPHVTQPVSRPRACGSLYRQEHTSAFETEIDSGLPLGRLLLAPPACGCPLSDDTGNLDFRRLLELSSWEICSRPPAQSAERQNPDR